MLIPKSSAPVKPKLTWRERAIAFLAPEEKPKLEAQAAERERVAAEETAAREKVVAREAHIADFKGRYEQAWNRPMGERELAKMIAQYDDHQAMRDENMSLMLESVSPRTMQGTNELERGWNQAARDYQHAANAGFKQT